MKTYTIVTLRTEKDGRKFRNPIGKLIEIEQEDGRVFKRLNLYMFPDTKFEVREDE